MIATFFDGLDVLYHHAKFGIDRTTHAGCRFENMMFVMFLGAMHQYTLRVLATATCLAGWLGGWLSVTASIVSKRLNLS